MTEEIKPKCKWSRYTELERLSKLRNEGRELIGEVLSVTEKRDGENVSVWLDEMDLMHVSSHNQVDAGKDIINRLSLTPEFSKMRELLYDEKINWHNDCILYGELLKTVSPTRIEPKRKYTHWILFDIYSITEGRYLNYTQVYQKGYHFKIPVVKLLCEYIPLSLDHLTAATNDQKLWCKKHRREGVVIKCYSKQIFCKEKIDLPDKPKLDRVQQNQTQYPPMPEETILRALKHAFDEIGESNWSNKALAMPCVAKHMNTEAREHNYNVPKNFYEYYVKTTIEELRGKKNED